MQSKYYNLSLCAALACVVALGLWAGSFFALEKLQAQFESMLNTNAYINGAKMLTSQNGSGDFLKKFGFAYADFAVGTGRLPRLEETEQIFSTAALFEKCKVEKVNLLGGGITVEFTAATRSAAEQIAHSMGESGGFVVELVCPADLNLQEYKIICK